MLRGGRMLGDEDAPGAAVPAEQPPAPPRSRSAAPPLRFRFPFPCGEGAAPAIGRPRGRRWGEGAAGGPGAAPGVPWVGGQSSFSLHVIR